MKKLTMREHATWVGRARQRGRLRVWFIDVRLLLMNEAKAINDDASCPFNPFCRRYSTVLSVY